MIARIFFICLWISLGSLIGYYYCEAHTQTQIKEVFIEKPVIVEKPVIQKVIVEKPVVKTVEKVVEKDKPIVVEKAVCSQSQIKDEIRNFLWQEINEVEASGYPGNGEYLRFIIRRKL